jgi:hypothetical protein
VAVEWRMLTSDDDDDVCMLMSLICV